MSTRHITMLILGGLLAGAWLATPAGAQYHEDTRHGFKFVAPDEYVAVAIAPTDLWTVAKYQAEQTQYGGDQGTSYLLPTFEITFYETSRVQESEDSDDEQQDDEPEDEFGEFEKSLSKERKEKAKEQLPPAEATWQRVSKRYGDFEVVKTKSLKIGRDRCEERHIQRAGVDVTDWIAILEQEDGVFVFTGDSISNRFDKAAKAYAKAAKSFKRIEKDGSLTGIGEFITQFGDQEQFLQSQIDKLPPGWDHLETERYLFLFNAEKNFVKDLADRIESLRDTYEEMWPPRREIEAISIVRVCTSVEEYYGYGGRPGTGGYWSPGAQELVFFDMAPRSFTMAVLNHEAFHQYIFYACGELSPHSWYNEGTGDYFAGAKMTKTHRIQGFGDAPGGIGRQQTVKEACRLRSEGKPPATGVAKPLKDLMGYTQQEYYKDGGTNYAQGWALVHMLREAKGLKPEWQVILDEYFDNLLAARHEVAVETMQQTLEHAKKRGDDEEAIERISKEPEDYYSQVNNNGEKSEEVRTRAYKATFKDWTDADWDEFDAFFLKYVEKL